MNGSAGGERRGEDLGRAIGEHLARARALLAEVESAAALVEGQALRTHGARLVAALERADQAEALVSGEWGPAVQGHLLAARCAAQAALASAAWCGVTRSSPVLARIGAIYGHLGSRVEASLRVASATARAGRVAGTALEGEARLPARADRWPEARP